MPLDLTLAPLYRLHGQEPASLPGLSVAPPPRKTARGREVDRLAVQLLLTGNATFSVSEYAQVAALAAERFHQSPGPMTSAMRAAAEAINAYLLDRNMSTSSRGQYVIGWLALLAVRDTHCTVLLSGPLHAFIMGAENRHVFEPALSGRGLGIAQSTTHYFTQTELRPGDRILLAGRVPSAWETILSDAPPAPLEVMRRRLMGITGEDLHALLMQASEGPGAITLTHMPEARPAATGEAHVAARPPAAAKPQPEPAAPAVPQPEPQAAPPTVHPVPEAMAAAPEAPAPEEAPPPPEPAAAAYAIPPQPAEEPELAPQHMVQSGAAKREFPPSIPRRKPAAEVPAAPAEPAALQSAEPEPLPPALRRTGILRQRKPKAEKPPRDETPREPSPATRQAAKAVVGGMRAWRRGVDGMTGGVRRALPRLLPGDEAGVSRPIPAYVMAFIALVIPILVVTAALVVYLRFGRSAQYENYLAQAQTARQQAASLTDPIMQRDAWQSVLLYVDKAESYRHTPQTDTLRTEAEGNLDSLLGVVRLPFKPAFSTRLDIQISRMAATESDLYLLDARTGEIVRAELTGRGFQRDTAFQCKPGLYGSYQVGPLVDIAALPLLNAIKATVVGVDATGNLLYCAPGQVPQAIPLPPPDTNWGRVTAMTLDAGNLYVLDAPSRAVWVYAGMDSAFVDRPYFFFTEQIPEIQDSIDLVVKDDSLYLLHADGHLSTCSYSRIQTVPTRCQDPAQLINPYPAYKDVDLFAQAHITQMMYTAPPDSTILLLGADSQGVLRLTPASLELQGQIRPPAGKANPLPPGPVDAMAAGPNHVLYLAVKDQVYFAQNMP